MVGPRANWRGRPVSRLLRPNSPTRVERDRWASRSSCGSGSLTPRERGRLPRATVATWRCAWGCRADGECWAGHGGGIGGVRRRRRMLGTRQGGSTVDIDRVDDDIDHVDDDLDDDDDHHRVAAAGCVRSADRTRRRRSGRGAVGLVRRSRSSSTTRSRRFPTPGWRRLRRRSRSRSRGSAGDGGVPLDRRSVGGSRAVGPVERSSCSILAMFGRPLFGWSANDTTADVTASSWIRNVDWVSLPGAYRRRGPTSRTAQSVHDHVGAVRSLVGRSTGPVTDLRVPRRGAGATRRGAWRLG